MKNSFYCRILFFSCIYMFKLISLVSFYVLFLLGCGSQKEIENGRYKVASDTNSVAVVWDGKVYHANSNIQYNWVQSMLSQLPLKGNEHILDVGTGTGKIAAELSHRVPRGQVIGFDTSLSMLEKAQLNYPKKRYPNLQFLQQDALDSPLKNKFDVVVSFWLLHWIKNKEVVFRNIYGCLKPGGKALFYFGPDEGKHRLDQAIEKVAHQSQWPDSVRRLKSGFFLDTAKNTHNLLTRLGFKIRHFKVVVQEETFKTKKQFIHWIRSWLPHLAYLTEVNQVQFIEAIVKEYISGQAHRARNTDITFLDYMLEVVVEK